MRSAFLIAMVILNIPVAGYASDGTNSAAEGFGEAVAGDSKTNKTNLEIQGKAVHERILKTCPQAKLDVWGAGFPDVKACFWIPESEWSALTTNDRKSLIEYLKSQIPEIRSDPDRFLTDIPRNAPVYGKLRSNIANMKDGQYVIFTMEYRDGKWVQLEEVASSK